MKKYLFIAAAAMFALPSMAAEDAPKKNDLRREESRHAGKI